MGQFMDAVVGIHGPGIKNDFRRSKPQPKNGAQIVTEELEALNRRFAQLSSLILERRNNMQVLIQNWKRQKQVGLFCPFFCSKAARAASFPLFSKRPIHRVNKAVTPYTPKKRQLIYMSFRLISNILPATFNPNFSYCLSSVP